MGKPANKTVTMPVRYGNVAVGKDKVRVGVKVDRSGLGLTRADELFCNAQLEVTLKCDPNAKDDAKRQETFEAVDLSVAMVADAKRYSVGDDTIGVSLSIPKVLVDIAILSQFAAGSGTMECERVGDATGADDEDE